MKIKKRRENNMTKAYFVDNGMDVFDVQVAEYLYFEKGKKPTEIANLFGVSESYIRCVLKKEDKKKDLTTHTSTEKQTSFSDDYKTNEIDNITNLIVNMVFGKATDEEFKRAIDHSRNAIDAKRNGTDCKRSRIDNCIDELVNKYFSE